jgi:hypothetical protein|tara:strand:- start:1610 stop:2017 length:408 start_codon:yes stop_codon:yes gene_type:complete
MEPSYNYIMHNIVNIRNSQSINTTGSSLIGHITGTYTELIKAFGEPTYIENSADDKVSTEWNLEFELADNTTPYIIGTIYDWKRYDGGEACRGGDKFVWNVGGMNYKALELIQEKLGKEQTEPVGEFLPLRRSHR